MSLQAMEDFMAMVATTEALHEAALQAWSRGGMPAVIALGMQHGYHFTPEEVIAVRDAASLRGSTGNLEFDKKLEQAMSRAEVELSDEELDMVAGGGGGGAGPQTADKFDTI